MTDEIDALVKAYNKAESQQAERLTRLFQLMYSRSGYRRVNFGNNHVWSNCWQQVYDDRIDLALRAHVVPFIHLIVEYDKGVA